MCRVVLRQDDKFFMVQESSPDAQGQWTFPGGWRERSETLEAAATRETTEKVGLETEVIRRLVMDTSRKGLILNIFQADVTGGELQLQPEEVQASGWFSRSEIDGMRPNLRDPEFILGAVEEALGYDHPIRR